MKLSLLHDQYKRGELLQGRIMAINKTTGVISVFIRNGLTTTATYLYDINELRVGGLVLIGVVSGSYVILNRLCNNPSGQSYSMRKPRTATKFLYVADGGTIWKLDPKTLTVVDSLEGCDPGYDVISVASNPNTRKIYFNTTLSIWELDVDTFTYRVLNLPDVDRPRCLTIDKTNNILYFFHHYWFYKVDPTTDTILAYFNAPAPSVLGGPMDTLAYDPHHNVLIGVSQRLYRHSEIIKINCDPFGWSGSWSLNVYGPLRNVYAFDYGSLVDESEGGKAYISIPVGYDDPYPYHSGVYRLDLSSGMTIEDYVLWDGNIYGDASAISIKGTKLYVGLDVPNVGGAFAEIDLITFSQRDRQILIEDLPGWGVPQCAAFDDTYAYVACWSDDGNIVKIDLNTFSQVALWSARDGEYVSLNDCVLM